jgi:2-polyprenyl-6-methoxyphenol hydroxylase-like FAD-dependent oxidoreductase
MLPKTGDLPAGLDYVRTTFQDHPSPIPALINATPADQLVRNDIIDRSMPHRWSHGRVTVLGDAAHPMRPHLGQGGCQAIEDAAVRAGLLSQTAPEVTRTLARYERLRRRRTTSIVRRSRYARLTYSPGLRTRALDRVISKMHNFPIGVALYAMRPIASYNAGRRASAA